MTARKLYLVLVWVAFFVVSLVVTAGYALIPDSRGMVRVLADDVIEAWSQLAILYGAYLGGILGAWYKEPLRMESGGRVGQSLMFIASLVCTVLFGVIVNPVFLRGFFVKSIITDDIEAGVRLGWMLSFLVAPINLYYFGFRSSQRTEGGASVVS